MKKTFTTNGMVGFCQRLSGVLIVGIALTRAEAAPVEFTIDPAQSSITLAGNVVGTKLQEQAPGSLTTTFFGKIVGDVSGTTIQFPGGSAIAANTNGVWEPGPGGASGSAPGDYAGQASILFGTVKGALRNLLLDMTSGSLTMTNGQFDASALVFKFPTNSVASFDYDAGFIGHDGIPLTGYSTNKIVNGATLTTVGSVQTLSIQIDTLFTFTAVKENDSSVRLTGQLIATQTTGPSITAIEINGQTVTIRVQGAAQNATVQVSHDLKSWAAETATRSDDASGTVFTLPASGNASFYFVAQ